MVFALNRKGSISIEFILLIGIALIYINGVVWPIADSSSNATAEVKAVADTKIAAMKLGNAINEASVSSGDMKKTVQLFVPENAEIGCTPASASLGYTVYLDYIGAGFNPDEMHCTDYPVPPADPEFYKCSSSIDLVAGPDNCIAGTVISGPILRDIVVKKDAAGISVEWAT
jgi:hypothetical protein